MSIQGRKERERAQRHQLIVSTARQLAEAEGWDAVTTRRLAALIEYSQPVLYSHFAGKAEIMKAAALEGFQEMYDALHAARTGARSDRAALAAVAKAYLEFAEAHPALYDAMFTLNIDIPFAAEDTPPLLRATFAELETVVRPLARPRDHGTMAETFWSALHGLVALTRSRRLPAETAPARLRVLIDAFWRA